MRRRDGPGKCKCLIFPGELIVLGSGGRGKHFAQLAREPKRFAASLDILANEAQAFVASLQTSPTGLSGTACDGFAVCLET